MVDTPVTPPNPTQPAAAAPKVNTRVLTQYIRDMSFENILAQKGMSGDLVPEISVQVNLDGRQRGTENQYEVITKLNITSKVKATGEVLYLLVIEYAGVFLIEGVPVEQMHPFLMIECPRITFPFLRRIVSDVTRDGGFVPLNLEIIDFVGIYRNELARRAQAQAAAAPAAPKLDS